MSMLEFFQKHTNPFKHIFNLKIISNINTKIAIYIGLAAYWVVMLSSTFLDSKYQTVDFNNFEE